MTEIAVPCSVIALTVYALWAIVLVVFIALSRVSQVMSGKAGPGDFPSGTKHGSDGYWRLNRAHLNTLENLPIFGALVLAGWVAGLDTPTFNMLATVIVVARVVQSLIHISSGSALAINLRFLSLLVQLVCEVWMAVQIFHAAKVF
ncbi:MAG TPA: MAPEG family protein [Rhizomicrobium sp.]|nr:MAPEG family protein [Rhizomicrobium sp.]